MEIDQVVNQFVELRKRLIDEVRHAWENEDESIALATQQRWIKDMIALLERVMPDEISIFQTALTSPRISSKRTIGASPVVGMFMDNLGKPADAYLKVLIESLKNGRRQLNTTEHSGKSRKMSKEKPPSNHVFIVHGHDDAMKQAVARTLERLGLNPIILHEQPDGGKTIIEKFEKHSDVGFAVVLLSPDDMGYKKADGGKKAKPRARQNVILELGYFVGRLERGKVMALIRGNDLEVPGDLDGVVYTPFDEHEGWQKKLVKELKAAGYDVDANAL